MAGPAGRSPSPFDLAWAGPQPVTRPHGRAAFVAPLAVAATTGLAVGLAPRPTLVVVAATVSVVVLVLRVEWAALALVSTAVFEDYLDLVWVWSTEWLAAVLLAAWLVRRARGALGSHRLRRPATVCGVFLGIVALAYLAHPHGVDGLEVCLRYGALVAVTLVLADCLSGPLPPRRAARAYVVSCLLAALCALATAALSEGHRAAGPLADADTLAFFLVAAAPLVGTVRSGRRPQGWWVWASFVALLAAGVGTQSAGALLGLLVMVVVAVATGLLAARHAGIVLALLATGVALVLALRPVPVAETVADARQDAGEALEQHDDLHGAALEMVRDSPALGLGPGAFALLHGDHVGRDARPEDRARTGHSTPLEVAAELGLLGLAALYAVWVLPGAAALRRWLRDRSRLTASTLLALAGVLTVSLVEAQQYALPLWFLAAMAHAQSRGRPRRAAIFAAHDGSRTSGQPTPSS